MNKYKIDIKSNYQFFDIVGKDEDNDIEENEEVPKNGEQLTERDQNIKNRDLATMHTFEELHSLDFDTSHNTQRIEVGGKKN